MLKPPRKDTAAGRADCQCGKPKFDGKESVFGAVCRFSSCTAPKVTDKAKKQGVALMGCTNRKEIFAKMSEKELKRKFALWIKNSTLDLVEEHYKKDNCISKSEFIEKAVVFYTGYLSANENGKYIPNVVTSSLKSIIDESDTRMSRMVFKLAVELAMTMNIIAATHDIDESSLTKLRGECVKEVKKHNGTLTFDDAVEWQKG